VNNILSGGCGLRLFEENQSKQQPGGFTLCLCVYYVCGGQGKRRVGADVVSDIVVKFPFSLKHSVKLVMFFLLRSRRASDWLLLGLHLTSSEPTKVGTKFVCN
jgi:hypothetical protein